GRHLGGRGRPVPPAPLVAGGGAGRGRQSAGVDQGARHRPRQAGPGRLHDPRGAPPQGARVAPGAGRVPVRADLLVGPGQGRARGGGRGLDPRHAYGRGGSPRPLPARVVDGPAGRAQAARRRAGRARAGGRAGVSEPAMRWWGWGEPPHPVSLSEAGLNMLRSELGVPDRTRRPIALERVELPEAAPIPEALARFGAVSDHEARVTHAAGRSYPDLVRLRWGDGSGAPDAVLFPSSHADVAEVVRIASEEDVAVIPFGGGTSVVGGVEALRNGHRAAVSLDLRGLD